MYLLEWIKINKYLITESSSFFKFAYVLNDNNLVKINAKSNKKVSLVEKYRNLIKDNKEISLLLKIIILLHKLGSLIRKKDLPYNALKSSKGSSNQNISSKEIRINANK